MIFKSVDVSKYFYTIDVFVFFVYVVQDSSIEK